MSLLSLDQIKTLYDDLRGRIEDGGSVINFLPVDNASGSIASFPDGADNVPVKSLIAQITPLQDLHGQSAPYPAGGGKNKLPSWENGGTIGTTTIAKQADGYININGPTSGQRVNDNAVTLAAGTYTFSLLKVSGSVNNAVQFDVRKVDNTTVASLLVGASTPNGSQQKATFTLTESGDYMFSIYAAATITSLVLGLMVEEGSTATDFMPYSNICPISGWAGAKITRTGKNLFTYDGVSNIVLSGGVIRSGKILNLPAGTYTFSVYQADIFYYEYDNNGYVTGNVQGSAPYTFTLTNKTEIKVWAGNGVSFTRIRNVQLEEGSTATTYEAYNGNIINVDWTSEGTVYGGTLTYIGGGKYSLQATKGYAVYDGSDDESWAEYASGNGFRLLISEMASGEGHDGLANFLPTVNNLTSLGIEFGRNDKRIYIAQGKTITGVTDLSSWQTYLGNNNLVIVYPLATLPDPIILDAEDVKTLLGDNNIFVDTGDVSVDYRADIALYIQKVVNA